MSACRTLLHRCTGVPGQARLPHHTTQQCERTKQQQRRCHHQCGRRQPAPVLRRRHRWVWCGWRCHRCCAGSRWAAGAGSGKGVVDAQRRWVVGACGSCEPKAPQRVASDGRPCFIGVQCLKVPTQSWVVMKCAPPSGRHALTRVSHCTAPPSIRVCVCLLQT